MGRDKRKLTIGAIRDLEYSDELRKKLNRIAKEQNDDERIANIKREATEKENERLLVENGVLFTRGDEKDAWRVEHSERNGNTGRKNTQGEHCKYG